MSLALELTKHVADLRSKDRDRDSKPVIGLDLFIALAQAWGDPFGGDSLDTRWATAVTGTGVAAAIQATSPSRVLMDTGTTNGSNSDLQENALYKWSAADKFTLLTRAKLSSTASIAGSVCRVSRVAATDDIVIWHNTAVMSGSFTLRCTAAGVSTDSAEIATADTNWHTFALSVKTGSARARVDGGVVTEITTNVPTVDMQILKRITCLIGASKTMELDYVIMVPGYNLF